MTTYQAAAEKVLRSLQAADLGDLLRASDEIAIPTIAAALAKADAARPVVRLRSEDVEWVVNDLAELGVKIGNQFFFLYKGESLVYGELEPDPTVPPTHSEENKRVGYTFGDPIRWRPVFKREFGECCHPINRENPALIGTVSLSDSEDWQALPPAAPPAPAAPVVDEAMVERALKAQWAAERANKDQHEAMGDALLAALTPEAP